MKHLNALYNPFFDLKQAKNALKNDFVDDFGKLVDTIGQLIEIIFLIAFYSLPLYKFFITLKTGSLYYE